MASELSPQPIGTRSFPRPAIGWLVLGSPVSARDYRSSHRRSIAAPEGSEADGASAMGDVGTTIGGRCRRFSASLAAASPFACSPWNAASTSTSSAVSESIRSS